MVADSGTCACHVHVGVPSRDLDVQVLARLRPWLAPLLAVTANSPIAGGHDTGWARPRRPSAEVQRASSGDGEGAAGAGAATPVVPDSVVHK